MNFLPIDVITLTNDFEDKTLALLKGDALTYMIRRDGCYEQHFTKLAKLIIKEGDFIIDAGANLGYHTITLSKLVGNSGKVIAIEPQRITFQQLNCNVFLNKLDNVFTFNVAIGKENGMVYIEEVDYYKEVENSFGTNIGNTSINMNGKGDGIQQITIDHLTLPKVNFIKFDIQGCEFLALQGAKETILKHRPYLFIEMEDYHLVKFASNSELLQSYLKSSLGYKIFQIKAQTCVDYFCVPIEKDLDITYNYTLVEI